jgi:hypothetical protein
MPKDERGKNRKYKHHQDRTFTPLSKEQMERAEKIARGEKVEDEEEEVEQKPAEREAERFQPRKL